MESDPTFHGQPVPGEVEVEIIPFRGERLDVYLARQRSGGGVVYLSIAGLLGGALAALPILQVPVSVGAQGVIRAAAEAQPLVATVGGTVIRSIPSEQRRVAAGDTVLLLRRDDLVLRAAELDARSATIALELSDLQELASAVGSGVTGRAPVAPVTPRLAAEWGAVREELAAARERIIAAEDEASVASALHGRALLPAREARAARDRVIDLRRDSALVAARTLARWRGESAERERELQAVQSERAAIGEQLAQLAIISPTAGWLDDPSGLAVGSYVGVGTRVAALTPDSELIAELYLDPGMVDSVVPGMKVWLQVQSRRFTGSQPLPGRVSQVDPVLVPLGDAVFARIRISLETAQSTEPDAGISLRRGTTVTGRIPIGRRSGWALLRLRREGLFGEQPIAGAPPADGAG